MSSILFKNIKQLIGVSPHDTEILRGKDLAKLPILENAWLLAEGVIIRGFGTMKNCPDRADEVYDATDRVLMPTWCDSHTHLVYAGTRETEFVDRIKGLSYEEIANNGGGILNSSKKLEQCSESELFDQSWERLEEVISMGTGAIEIKSGYGLSLE
ncbi:MAG: imidazolonepropionase, partial [Sphingobacteriales bacterium]